ncbi:MAG: AAA family ATPase [Nitrospiraceae bacterium]|nr:MAG: AAA family ATPase [Nitrospiraceae bacterium]
MYTKHFGLNRLPFENVPDPAFFFDQGDYHNVRSHITDSLKAGRGLMVVTGTIGSGKTTLSQMIKSDFADTLKLVWIAEPPANSMDLFLYLAQELGLKLSSSERTFVIRDIREALLKTVSDGTKCLIIIDESHLMSEDTFNGIRLLNNLEEGSAKLIQMLLLGQEEIMDKINKPEMEPFKQRIAALEILGTLDTEGIQKYISHRLQIAGGHPDIFKETGWKAISIAFKPSGTPRMINTLCDRSLQVAFNKKKEFVDAHDVYEATQKIGMVTDVFHYIVSLKSKQKEQLSESPVPVEEAPAQVQKPEIKLPDVNEHTDIRPMNSYAPLYFDQEGKRKGLKGPLILLGFSLVTLAASIMFYCHQSASSGLVPCLLDLLGV